MTMHCPTCHDFRRVCDGAGGSSPCPTCTTKPRSEQIIMLSQATERAAKFCKLALAVVEGAPFDQTAATTALMEALACLAAAFDDDVPDEMFRSVVQKCGLARALPGRPANDDHFVGGAA